jgi:hypothetical protein
MNTKNKNVICAAVMLVLMALTGCGPRDTRSFPKLKRDKPAQAIQREVEVSVHLLSRQDCVAYFDVDIIAQGYRPLVLTIENSTENAYTLRPSYLDVARVSGKEISRLMHYDTYQRVTWLTLPALIYWWPAIPFLIVPYGLGCQHYNKKTTRNIRKKTLGRDDVVAVAPYETVSRFIFVPAESFKTKFDLKLFNETRTMLETFAVNCAEQLIIKKEMLHQKQDL